MNFIDTHAHIYLSAFDEDRNKVIARAIKNNVTKIFLPNIDSSSVKGMLDLCNDFPDNCFPMIGLHPTSVKKDFENELINVDTQLKSEKFIAIGETGIDLYWDKTFLEEQIIAFKEQIKLAKFFNLPIVIHTRDSFKEVFKILDEVNDTKLNGVFHCFSGNIEEANKAISYGFKLGIGGVITFKNSKLVEVIKNINIKHIILETDAPFLSPMPYRGKRNESLYINIIAKKISELYNEKIEIIAEATTQNAEQLFKL